MRRIPLRSATLAIALSALVTAATISAASTPTADASQESPMHNVVPAPSSVRPNPSADYRLTEHSAIRADATTREAASYLAGILRRSTGFPLPITQGQPQAGDIAIRADRSADVGPSGYRLRVADDRAVIQVQTARGAFYGVQTLRQVLPPTVDSPSVQPGPWTVPGGEIVDRPRFEHRAAMLDVARHFFDVDEVKRYVDQIAQYKLNYLHLHLSDDQGWRIQINSWPRLAKHGGSTEVGGGPGGYYTQQEYTEIVNYAAARHITIVPEIDMPGHTNAALASYAKLNCDGVAPPLYTGIEVGFSSLCVPKDVTYRFLDDVIRELSALTPGPYLHIGGDEADATTDEDYRTFMNRVLPIVAKYGKTPVGWHEYVKATPKPSAVVQFWDVTRSAPEVAEAAKRGNRILLSPANKAYLDMKYDRNTELGLDWAGLTSVRDAYEWDPGSYLRGVPERSVLGVEAPLWSETLENSKHIEFMAFPRLPAIAELGWSDREKLDWNAFRHRLAAQGPRWDLLGIGYHRAPSVPWPESQS